MARYSAYLEIDDNGVCMAHVLDPSDPVLLGHCLPGCIVRAPKRELALQQLPEAIRDHRKWLRSHGELILPEMEPIEITVAEESHGFGPFNPGDAAALFGPDRSPLTSGSMERFYCLMNDARDDLLATFNSPSPHQQDDAGLIPPWLHKALDWQPDASTLSIRHVLRHIGNAEEWYVSRLVPPDSLPPEWEHDADVELFAFLAMERRTVVDRLRHLTEHERSAIFHPTHWTEHPEESWTARKVLRRFIEHEREHTKQAQEILHQWNSAVTVAQKP